MHNILVSSGLTPYVILFSATITYVTALISWQKNQAIAQQRATLDLIDKTESSQQKRDLAAAFKYCEKRGFDDSIHDPEHEDDRTRRYKVQQFLNQHEILAIGIKRNVLEETILKDWNETQFVHTWNVATPFIQKERWHFNKTIGQWDYNNKLWEHFGEIAHKWDSDAIIINRNSSQPPEKTPHQLPINSQLRVIKRIHG